MNNIPLIVTNQTLVMFLYMIAGFFLYKYGKITEKGSKEIASLLVWLVIPTVLINSFCTEFSTAKLASLGISTLAGALSLLISILIGRLFFRKSPVDDFAAAFSNAGFIGIPLVAAALGSDAVFYLVGMVALLNILQWTYGVCVLTGKKSAAGPKSILLNPIMAATVIGLILFLTGAGAHLPGILSTTIKGISALNAPLAMIVLGVYLAQSDMKAMFTTLKLYGLCAVRLLLIPLATLIIFRFLPMDQSVKLTILIASSAPVGANVAVYSQLHGLDYAYACQTVALSTVISIATLPLIMALVNLLI